MLERLMIVDLLIAFTCLFQLSFLTSSLTTTMMMTSSSLSTMFGVTFSTPRLLWRCDSFTHKLHGISCEDLMLFLGLPFYENQLSFRMVHKNLSMMICDAVTGWSPPLETTVLSLKKLNRCSLDRNDIRRPHNMAFELI
ncbi:uncharacterized protein EV420DRAFT_1540339 [Desarmillaria tabescens]|uniref:Uncharacterized protein n=1 Tax=Armillaria tabescens TaxID=1929756 RepID=A0AA39KCS9_ARMTA|nr:uncharacterized protein EV420DRAFT_1540339 [Desarmillaria tabescens]KAK0458755.1 hypothetical protein EV420DRAFT_1540339 [Desarmillaria tabescens]